METQQAQRWQEAGLCKYCGGKFSFWTSACATCGRGHAMKCNYCGGKLDIGDNAFDGVRCSSCKKRSTFFRCYYCGGKMKGRRDKSGGCVCQSCGKFAYYI